MEREEKGVRSTKERKKDREKRGRKKEEGNERGDEEQRRSVHTLTPD